MTLPRPVIRIILALLLAAGLPCHAEWQERKINGRGYVSVASMKSFYGFDKMERDAKEIRLENAKVKIDLRIGSGECLMNGVKFVFSYGIEEHDGQAWVSKVDLIKLVDPVLRPQFIGNSAAFQTVVIDAGHGGRDPGATNPIGEEADYNLKVAKLVKTQLEAARYTVVMTRETDVFLTLQQRVDIANRIPAGAIFVSIHHNAGQSKARGIETFTLSPIGVAHYGAGLKESDFRTKQGNLNDSANVALATSVHGCLLQYLTDPKTKKSYTLDRGIKRARFSVLSGVRHPSILVECGFMSNPYEARLIDDAGYQRTVAKSIAIAISKYRAATGGAKGKG